MSVSKKQMDYMNERIKKNYKRYTLAFNKDTQNDIIQFLEKNGPTQTTIVNLVREYLKSQASKQV
jgi:hypothetical protein